MPTEVRVASLSTWSRLTTRQRVARVNDERDVLRDQRLELAIVDRATWDAVQALLSDR